MQREIDLVVETLKNAKHWKGGCSLLIGAGCSVKAGIPAATKFTEIIKDRFPEAYKLAEEKSYPQCMAQLSFGDRRKLIAEFVDQAKINWAHICIAQMMKHGYIDRVLTVNFDPLVVMACALLGIFPAVYDFAASQLFKPADIPDQAVFYLHGQRSGFVILNTDDEVNELSQHLEPVFSDAGRGRVWLVAGYSGLNDPVFGHLAKVERFDNRLYWVCYKDDDPPVHVREQLLVKGKDAFYVKGYDADDFFVTLAQKLGCFPPDIVGKPFSHLEQLLTMMTPYSLPGHDSTMDVNANTMKYIREAIERYGETFQVDPPTGDARPATDETREDSTDEISALSRKATELFMAGDYEMVVALRPDYDRSPTPELAYTLAWAYLAQGNDLYNQAEAKTDAEADELFGLAVERYKAALEISPDYSDAFNNWGNTLATQAKTKTGDEADRLFNQAIEKYKAALEIKPDYTDALNNLGLTLYDQSQIKPGNQAEQLINQAIEKYKAALEIKPDSVHILNNYGCALYKLAKMRENGDADRLLALASEKLEEAVTIRPDYFYALDSLGVTLAEQAKRSSGAEAERLYASAYENLDAAVKVNPNYHEALNNWSKALVEHARTKSGEEAARLQVLAIEKHAAARQIRPDLYQSWV